MISVHWALPAHIDASIAHALDEVLDTGERARALRMHAPADRRAFTIAHAMLRFASSAWTGRLPAVSLSHVRTCVACALGDGGAIGVDVEEIGRIALDDPSARASCTPREIECLAADGVGEERDRRFATFWTRKEACFKASDPHVLPEFNAFDTLDDPVATLGLHLATFELTPRHVLSVACAACEPIELRQYGDEELWRALQSARAAR